MQGVNKVVLLGNLGADPEVRTTPSGQMVANFRLAANESWTDKAGVKQERTEWVRVVAWGKLGELCGQYLAKGRQAFVEGKLQTREWTDKENRKQYTTEVVAQNVVFLGSRGAGTTANGPSEEWQPPPDPFADAAPGASASRERSRGDGTQMQAHRGAPADMDIPF